MSEIMQDPCRWLRFLGEGRDLATGWDPGLLPGEQSKALLRFILTHFPGEDLSGLKSSMHQAGLLRD